MKEKNNYKKLYEREFKQQEAEANARILRGFWYFIFMFFFIYALSVVKVFRMDFLTMTFALAVVLGLCLTAINLGKIVKMTCYWLKYVLLAMICMVCATVCGILTVHAEFIYVLPLLFAIQCRQTKALWYTYLVNLVTMAIGSLAGFYYGICDLNILTEGNYSLDRYMNFFYDDHLHLALCSNFVLVILIYQVFPRALILLVFTLMLRQTVVYADAKAIQIAELTWKKERDIVTGVYNKNIYEEMSDGYFPNIDKVSAIYFDLNNLKKTNDQYGHEEGDALIYLLAECLMDQGDERYRVFRLGGDEFLMTIDNPQTRESEHTIERVISQLKNKKTERGLSVTTAVGWSAGDGRDIRRVVKTADANMYANKIASKEGRNKVTL